MPDKPPKSGALTERNIRQAAIALIARDGYESMSLRQLAAEAGVNPATLYLYYEGKKELLMTLVLDYLSELQQAWQECKPKRARPDNVLRAFVRFHVRYHLERKAEGVLGNMELRSLDADERGIVQQARRTYLRELQDILEAGNAKGLFHCDHPKLLTSILFNMLTHVVAWYRSDGAMSIDEVVEHYSELVLRMVGYTPPSSR
ncbi:hypothetical protein D9M68_373430 [compost metagenome]